MKAIGYVRVSTEDQAAEGVSLAAQGERIGAYCVAQGWELTAVYLDAGASAKSLDRDGLHAALEAVQAGEADVLLTLKLDRLTRSVTDLGRLIESSREHGFQLAAVSESLDTTTAAGRMMANVLASVAQWEREACGERTAAALAHKKSIGEHVGLIPFGFSMGADGHLEENAEELATIQRMKRWRRRGASYREIARRLDAAKVQTRRGNWADRTVRRLCSEHLNARKAKYSKGLSDAAAA